MLVSSIQAGQLNVARSPPGISPKIYRNYYISGMTASTGSYNISLQNSTSRTFKTLTVSFCDKSIQLVVMVSRTRPVSVLPARKITFKSGESPDRYNCVECKLLLQDPVQLSCGHRVCKNCADELISNAGEITPQCPECGDEISEEDGMKVSIYSRSANSSMLIAYN